MRLYFHRERLDAADGAAGGQAPRRPVLFLVHGSSVSSRSAFDSSVPGNRGECSLMDVFARRGWDVRTMDHEGYGRPSRTAGNSDVASGAADLLAAEAVVERGTGERRFHLLGENSGALRAARFAQGHPERDGRLVLWPSPGPAAARRRWSSGRRTWSSSAPTAAARAGAT